MARRAGEPGDASAFRPALDELQMDVAVVALQRLVTVTSGMSGERSTL